VWFGLAGVYFAATLISAVAILMLLPLPAGIAVRQGPPLSPAKQFTEGLRYVRDHREVKLLIMTSFVVVMVAFPYVAFMPRVATEMFDVGATGYGLLSAVSAIGAVLISFYAARNSSRESSWRLQTIAGFVFGIGVVLLAGAPVFFLALVAVFVIGAGSSAFQSMNNSLVLGLTDPGFHGRLQSLMMLSFSGFGMAALPLGMLADRIGLRSTFVLMGSVTVAMMVGYLAIRGPANAENGRRVADA
jgi:predicted MFS family arabinose efflux permease